MWSHTILRLLAFSLSGGMFCGVLHSFFKCVRLALALSEENRSKCVCRIVMFIQDLWFCLVSASVLCVAIYYGNDGKFRFVSVIGMILGFAAFKVSLGKFAEFVVDKIFSFVRKILFKLFKKSEEVFEKIVRAIKTRLKRRKKIK